MSKRHVTAITRSAQGYVTALCNPDEPWSPRSTKESVLDLELGLHSYFMQWEGLSAQVEAADDAGGRYLVCDPDKTGTNVLLTLT